MAAPVREPATNTLLVPIDRIEMLVQQMENLTFEEQRETLNEMWQAEALLHVRPRDLERIVLSGEVGLGWVLDNYEQWSPETIGELLLLLFENERGVAPVLLRSWHEHVRELRDEPYLREVEARCAAWLQ